MRLSWSLRFGLMFVFLGGAAAGLAQAGTAAYMAVDPRIGTAGDGNTFPGAALPFGMMQWSPDTGSEAWYYFKDKTIHGFSLTHLSGAGCPLYGDFPVLPTLWQGNGHGARRGALSMPRKRRGRGTTRSRWPMACASRSR